MAAPTPLLVHGAKGVVELRRTAHLQHVQGELPARRRGVDLVDLACKPGPGRVPEDGKAAEAWHQLREEFQPLGRQVRAHEALAGDVPARPRQAGAEPLGEGLGKDGEDDRNRRRRLLAARAPGPAVTSTSTGSCTNSSLGRASRSSWLSPDRYSIRMFCPSTYPRSRSPCRKGSQNGWAP